jgi:hypothetical protein
MNGQDETHSHKKDLAACARAASGHASPGTAEKRYEIPPL